MSSNTYAETIITGFGLAQSLVKKWAHFVYERLILLVVYSVIKRKFARLMLNGAVNRECVPQVTNKINEYSMNYILLINEMLDASD